MATTEILERNLAKSSLLSQQQMAHVIPLADVIRVLNGAKVSYVLVGAHGLSTWRGKPRATEDVDVVVAARHLKKAVATLLGAFSSLEAVDLHMVVRLRIRETENVVIDVMKPIQQPYREVFKHIHEIELDGERVRIPSLEMALVMKFSAISSVYRAEADKFQDAHDFIYMVKNNRDMDKEKLAEIAQLVYPEAGRDILEFVRKIEAGEKLTV